MKITESCVSCLYNRQASLCQNPVYLQKIQEMLQNRREEDTSPYMLYLFSQAYQEMFGKKPGDYSKIKKEFNDLVLSMEQEIEDKIRHSEDPLFASFCYARIGNYIDFGALTKVQVPEFLSLLDSGKFSSKDLETWEDFKKSCENAKQFLLITDNCGEAVLDKLFLKELRRAYPEMQLAALMKEAEALNDATLEDGIAVGLHQVASLYSNGAPVTGTVVSFLPRESKELLEGADVILAKGQANYETLSGLGYRIFYSFLCKCERFTTLFNVPQFTGIFIRE